MARRLMQHQHISPPRLALRLLGVSESNPHNAARTRVRSMGDLGSIDDAFDAALNLEESHIDEGWEDGLR